MQIEPIDAEHQPITSTKEPLSKRIGIEWITLTRLGTPILVGQLAQMANGVIDTLMAGRASAEDLSGVAIGNSLWVPLFLFMMGVLNATQPMVSGHRGAKSIHRIMPITWNAIYISLAAAAVAALLLTNVEPVLSLINMDGKSAQVTVGYLNAFVFGIPALLILISLRGLTDGLGHTKVFMSFSILTALINAPLNYVLIFGKFGFPEMGGVGCGWATAIAQWSGLILILLYLNRAKSFKDFHLWQSRMRPNKAQIMAILRLGVPIGFTIFVESTMFAVVALLIASLGPVVVAGHQIALSVVSVMFMLPLSIGLAITIRTSFLIGANQPDTARLLARSSILVVLVIAFIWAYLLYAFAEPLARLYSKESDVIAVAALLLIYGAIFQIADVVQVVCISALRGYKDTRIPMYIMVSSFWGIGIPLGYILAYKDWIVEPLGAPGFWIGLIAGLTHAAGWLMWRLYHFSGRPISELPAVDNVPIAAESLTSQR